MKHALSYHLIILSSIFLTACGFEPMAGQSTKAYDQQPLPDALASVDIQATGTDKLRMLGQDFRVALEDLVNPGNLNKAPKEYRLSVGLSPFIQPGFIAPDGKAQRFLVRLDSAYSFTRLSDGKLIEVGKMNRNSSYSNQPNSYYSTYIAEQDTLKRLSKELAEQYRMKLASMLSSPPPKDPGEMPVLEPTRQYLGPEQVIRGPSGQTY